MSEEKKDPKSKGEQQQQLSKELEETFPASDPPASTQPGSGITGPEVVQRDRPRPNEGYPMSKDNFEDAAGKARSVVGNVKDAISSEADAAASVDYSALRDDIVRLSQTVSDLVQKQTSAARDQVIGAVGAAADNIILSTSVAQDRLTSLEAQMESGIKKSPWTAMAIAALVGLLIGKLA